MLFRGCFLKQASLRQVEARAEELKAAAKGHEERAKEATGEVVKANTIIEKLSVRDMPFAAERLVQLSPPFHSCSPPCVRAPGIASATSGVAKLSSTRTVLACWVLCHPKPLNVCRSGSLNKVIVCMSKWVAFGTPGFGAGFVRGRAMGA
jgi:hypothetical protein